MKNKCLLLLLFASFPIFSWADETLDSLLHVLDQTILAHDTYVVQRESRIRHLKELAGDVAPNSIERYNLNNQIYKEYKAFICDSAIYYLNENVRIAGNLGDTDREIESKLQLSLLLSSTGMYTESIDVLKSVDRQKVTSHLILDYIHVSIMCMVRWDFIHKIRRYLLIIGKYRQHIKIHYMRYYLLNRKNLWSCAKRCFVTGTSMMRPWR